MQSKTTCLLGTSDGRCLRQNRCMFHDEHPHTRQAGNEAKCDVPAAASRLLGTFQQETRDTASDSEYSDPETAGVTQGWSATQNPFLGVIHTIEPYPHTP